MFYFFNLYDGYMGILFDKNSKEFYNYNIYPYMYAYTHMYTSIYCACMLFFINNIYLGKF
jgi:hypothetical protein